MDININGAPKDTFQGVAEVKQKKRSRLPIFLAGTVFGILVVTGVTYYKYPQIFTLRTPEEQAKIATQSLVNEVGKIMILPTGEEPTVLEITDPQSLISQQPFFTGAITGDKLLVYKQSARAIVYSPTRHLIVNVGPVTSEQTAATTQQSQPAATTPKKK